MHHEKINKTCFFLTTLDIPEIKRYLSYHKQDSNLASKFSEDTKLSPINSRMTLK